MSNSWGHGTTLDYSTDGGTTYTNIAEVIDIDAKKLKRAVIDTTLLSAATETARAGLIKPDPFKLKVQYLKSRHQALLAIFVTVGASPGAAPGAGAPDVMWRITLTDGGTCIGPGFMTEFDEIPKASNADVYEQDISIKPTAAWATAG